MVHCDQGEPTTGKNAGFSSIPAPIQIFFRYFNSVGHNESIDTKNFKIRQLIRLIPLFVGIVEGKFNLDCYAQHIKDNTPSNAE